MDPALYKTFTTSRSITYNYYFSPPRASESSTKPYLLFLHGFPSTSDDWRRQIPFFKSLGYGLIAPDMLGYGGTSIPTDPAEYRGSLVAKDLIELLDKEGVEKAVSIGHDWGTYPQGRLANCYPERFLAYAFLAVGYRPPPVGEPYVPYEHIISFLKKTTGTEHIGYWSLFTSPAGPQIMKDNIDSFMELLYAEDATLWKEYINPLGGVDKWLSEKKRCPKAAYISEEEIERQKEVLLKGGFEGPVCYYKIQMSDTAWKDAQDIPKESTPLTRPTFFAGAKRDCVSTIGTFLKGMQQACEQGGVELTYREMDSAHWIMLERADEVNKELAAWLEGLGL